MTHSAENGLPQHPHVVAVRDYLDNAGITPETLRYAATHEALCRSWIFDLLTGLAEVMEAESSAENDAPAECFGCFWDMRPGPWHTCPHVRIVASPWPDDEPLGEPPPWPTRVTPPEETQP